MDRNDFPIGEAREVMLPLVEVERIVVHFRGEAIEDQSERRPTEFWWGQCCPQQVL